MRIEICIGIFNKIKMKENITNTIETLNYYKDVLQTDFYLPYFFQDSRRVDTENENYMS